MLVEAVAQAGGFLLMALDGYSRMPVLTQVVKARIREVVEPGAVLTIEAEVQQVSSGISAIDGRISVAGPESRPVRRNAKSAIGRCRSRRPDCATWSSPGPGRSARR